MTAAPAKNRNRARFNLRGRLALMRDGMVAGAAPDMGNWLETLTLMSTYGNCVT